MSSKNPTYIQSVDATVIEIFPVVNTSLVVFTYNGVEHKGLVKLADLLNDDGSKKADGVDRIQEHISRGVKVTEFESYNQFCVLTITFTCDSNIL